ncbi:MAG: SGNH/GDSL hydrolase family protein [Candidatus Levybacteria bacterium]|nr:SGNH/GDSL hydrolase family protein [Candidatus Levybacteria bacterium]
MSLRERFTQSQRQPVAVSKETVDVSKRKLLVRGGVLIAAELSLPVLKRAYELNQLFGFSPLELAGVDVHELNHPLLETRSPHTPESLDRTKIFVVGDSMARGYDRDEIEPKSTGEYLRDIMCHPKGMQKNWDCKVLAENGKTVDDLMGQLDAIPELAQGEANVDIILSAGGNDFKNFLQTKQQEAKDTYESVDEMIFNEFDRDIINKLGEITSNYQRKIIPRLARLKGELTAQGVTLNRIAFINIPDLSKSNFEIQAEEVDLRIRYDSKTAEEDRNEWILKRFGKRLPYLANMWIGDHIWNARDELGDVMWLNAFGLPSEKLNGIHATAEGQFDLAVQYLAKTYMPVNQQTDQTLLAASKLQ